MSVPLVAVLLVPLWMVPSVPLTVVPLVPLWVLPSVLVTLVSSLQACYPWL
jgi:hypothetical protein